MFQPTAKKVASGNLRLKCIYRLKKKKNALVIEYRATTDKVTVVNLTNHGFLQSGWYQQSYSYYRNNIVTTNATFYTPIDEVLSQPEKLQKCRYSMDFTTPHTVGERINDKFYN